ncbi:hypothetical protein [Sodalis-like endosymbiont of Proechinophthirus fluctus]|uniref:hypothetical protein n=1 Tax=Sodalis-like endosymbiont of Proechinophthirus fluctus TaxID=1462730 RepID=UPI000AB445E4|nr:hypothetical protein [Sodalis-like endosymbiont of Proechinophthirus fluctus]
MLILRRLFYSRTTQVFFSAIDHYHAWEVVNIVTLGKNSICNGYLCIQLKYNANEGSVMAISAFYAAPENGDSRISDESILAAIHRSIVNRLQRHGNPCSIFPTPAIFVPMAEMCSLINIMIEN